MNNIAGSETASRRFIGNIGAGAVALCALAGLASNRQKPRQMRMWMSSILLLISNTLKPNTIFCGAAPLISSKVNLAYAASILAVEGYQVGLIRSRLSAIGADLQGVRLVPSSPWTAGRRMRLLVNRDDDPARIALRPPA